MLQEGATKTTPPETIPKVTSEVLDWNKQWYPVQAVQNLDPAKPHSITLLGMSVETTLARIATPAQVAILAQRLSRHAATFCIWVQLAVPNCSKYYVCHLDYF